MTRKGPNGERYYASTQAWARGEPDIFPEKLFRRIQHGEYLERARRRVKLPRKRGVGWMR